MMEFQSLFRARLREEKLTIYRLSKELQVDRSTLYQVYHGTRLPTAAIFQKLTAFFQLSVQEERQWLEAWKGARPAPRRYALRRQIEGFLQTLERGERRPPARRVHAPQPERTAGPCVCVEGAAEVARQISALLGLQRSVGEPGLVDLHLPFSFFSRPESAGFSLEGLRVRHLFALPPPGRGREAETASLLHLLEEILRRFLSVRDSRAYVPYFYNAPRESNFGLFPYSAAGGRRVFFVSGDLTHGLLLDNAQAAEAHRAQFDRALERAAPLVRGYRHPIQAMEELLVPAPDGRTASAHFFHQPCLVMYADREILDHALRPDCPNRENVLEAALAYYVESAAYGPDFYNYFTREGAAAFLAGGQMQEFPVNLVRPLPLEDRVTLLRRLRDSVRSPEGNVYCVRPELVSIPERLVLDVCFGRQILFSRSCPDALDYLVVSESGLVRGFMDYFRTLPATPGVASREESARLLDELLAAHGGE